MILNQMASVFPVEAGLLVIDDNEGNGPRVRAAIGVRPSEIPGDHIQAIWEIAGQEPWIVDDLGECGADQKLRLFPTSTCAAVVPLVAKDRIEGVLLLNSEDRGAFTRDQVTLLSTFGRQCGVAVSNAHLFEDLNALTRFNESVLQNIPIGVAVFGPDGEFRSTNAAFRSLFHESCFEEAGRATLESLPPLAGLDLRSELNRVFELRTPHSAGGVELTGSDTSSGILNIHLQPVLRGDRVHNVIMMVEDVTEEKKLQDELIRTEKLAAKGEMAAEIAHELNNYLTPIIGMVQLIPTHMARGDSGKTGQYCEVIQREAEKMATLVRGLLDFSHRDTRKTTCDLNQIVESTITFVRPQNRYDAVTFETDLSQTPSTVFVDPGQIQQVLLNLFANAADAIDVADRTGSRILVTTRVKQGTNTVVLTVNDEGPGIPDSVIDRVFDPGFTLKKTGHGFGLAVCSRVIENHGGEIELESRLGEGTTVIIHLPGSSELESGISEAGVTESETGTADA
jgi:signal transduction histidine kinase